MKQRIRYYLGTGAVRLVSLAVLAFLTLGAALYHRQYFDFTFFKRIAEPDYRREEPQETEPAVTPDTAELPVDTGTADTSSPDTEEPAQRETEHEVTPPAPEAVTARSVIAGLMGVRDAQAKGYTAQTGGIFSSGKWILAEAELSGLPITYSYSQYDKRALSVTEYERGCIWTEETTVKAPRPAVLLKNGYLIRDLAGKLTLQDLTGRTVISDYNEAKLALTDYRDAEGRAVFVSTKTVKEKVYLPILRPNEFTGRMEESGKFEEKETEVETVVPTYYVISDKNKLVETDLSESVPDCGLLFDMPADYGESDCDIERYAYGNRFGYRSRSTGTVLVYPRYRKAYNFHDGYAVCFDDYNMYILDMNGKAVYSAGCDRPEVFATFNELTYPDTNGIESLGFYYVSHGLTRVRLRKNLVTYRVYYYIKEDDYSTLIDTSGKEFPLPAGYLLQSYSDGLICLKKQDEDVYGYLNYRGEWVVQPEYRYAGPFLCGLAVLGTEDGKFGLVDERGAWVLPPVFDEISDVSSGAVTVYDRNTGWHVLRCMSR